MKQTNKQIKKGGGDKCMNEEKGKRQLDNSILCYGLFVLLLFVYKKFNMKYSYNIISPMRFLMTTINTHII